MGGSKASYWIAILILGLTVLYTRFFPFGREVSLRRDLTSFPLGIGEWRGEDYPFVNSFTKQLRVDDSLSRIYTNSGGENISLFVGFWKAQKSGIIVYTTRNVSPGRDWRLIQESEVSIPIPGNHPFNLKATRVLFRRNGDQELVLYWYFQAGRHYIASRYWGRLYTVLDFLGRYRTDVALIRVASPINDYNIKGVYETQKRFVQEVAPLLREHFPI